MNNNLADVSYSNSNSVFDSIDRIIDLTCNVSPEGVQVMMGV